MVLGSLVFGDVGLVVGSSGEAMVTDLADEGLHRQVDLRVLAQVGLGRKPRPTLRAHVRFCLIERRVSPVAGLGARQQRYGRVKGGGDRGGREATLWTVVVAEGEGLPGLPGDGQAGGGQPRPCH